MTNFKKQLFAAVCSTLVVLQAASPVLAQDVNLTINGNGSSSLNATNVTTSNNTTVAQSNEAVVTNNVTAKSDSGNNSSSFNVGETAIVTGGATSTANVTNNLNSNTANVNGCCDDGGTTVTVSGNGALSLNAANLSQTNNNELYQNNDAYVSNDVKAKANTGNNAVDFNTGGNTTIVTGPAMATANVSTTANANVAEIGGAVAGAGNGSVSVLISGNGALSYNSVYLDLTRDNLVVQDNYAMVYNDVHAKANSGDNSASFGTGGAVVIATGNAKAETNVDNVVNLNAATVKCDCAFDVLAKIASNGSSSLNDINGSLNNDTQVYQGGQGAGNFSLLTNEGGAKANSGYNDESFSVGTVNGDPIIATGNSWSNSDVNNTGNVNIFGGSMPAWWPWVSLSL